jgi:hypothetical protein
MESGKRRVSPDEQARRQAVVLAQDHLLPYGAVRSGIFRKRIFREISENGGFKACGKVLAIAAQAARQLKL